MSIHIENLSVSYPGQSQKAVDSVSFSVKSGSITALVGPNGSGKSSLIKAVLGLLPCSGKVRIMNKPLERVERLIGYVPQRYQADRQFPITKAEFLSLSDSSIKPKHISEHLELIGLGRQSNELVSDLSGGQLQRLLLARALITKPDVLILDEPESGVDVGGERDFYQLLSKLVKQRQLTILLASHELDLVFAYADQVVCLNKKLVCVGKPEDVVTPKALQAMYGSDFRMYQHHH